MAEDTKKFRQGAMKRKIQERFMDLFERAVKRVYICRKNVVKEAETKLRYENIRNLLQCINYLLFKNHAI